MCSSLKMEDAKTGHGFLPQYNGPNVEQNLSSIFILYHLFLCSSLQMEDAKTGHGFLPQYNGPNVEHMVTGLQRNTTYK
jgi:hypothetical protein